MLATTKLSSIKTKNRVTTRVFFWSMYNVVKVM